MFFDIQAGLSLDEIWSYGEESANTANNEETTATKDNPSSNGGSGDVVESDNLELVEESGTTTPPVEATVDFNDPATTAETLTELSELSPKNGFELIEDEDIDITGDPELDELEAEIARELEGL
mmetsp:Transcript_9606/g.19886  ORF Transcript_9606/g.19886 Transcript_9606/m.19886 type:complete len:124 (-) Transcript_9606:1166-1537(-)